MTDLPTPRRTYLFALVDGGGTVPPELGLRAASSSAGTRSWCWPRTR